MSVYLAAGLNDADMTWLLSLGRIRRLGVGQRLIAAGRPIDDLFFVLRGSLEVVREDGARAATIGEGEVVGEMSFVSEDVPSVSVLAAVHSEILVAPRSAILARFDQEPALAARFYRALAVYLSVRLREATSALELAGPASPEDASVGARLRRLLTAITGPRI
jgi:CRP/FNR family cyclic AMP-dependent transcriptional regulator